MGLNIKLTDSWRIRSDTNNIMLVDESSNRPIVEGYFVSLESALDSFIQAKIRGSNATSIEGLISYLKSLTTALNKAIAPLNIQVQPINQEVASS